MLKALPDPLAANPVLAICRAADLSPLGQSGQSIAHAHFASLVSLEPAFVGCRQFAASIALLTGFGNGKSPSPRAKGDRGLRLRHWKTEAPTIGLFQGVPLP